MYMLDIQKVKKMKTTNIIAIVAFILMTGFTSYLVYDKYFKEDLTEFEEPEPILDEASNATTDIENSVQSLIDRISLNERRQRHMLNKQLETIKNLKDELSKIDTIQPIDDPYELLESIKSIGRTEPLNLQREH